MEGTSTGDACGRGLNGKGPRLVSLSTFKLTKMSSFILIHQCFMI